MRPAGHLFATLAAAAAFAAPVHAQAPAKGWRAEYLDQMKDIEGKYVQLATAMPWDKYSWRPGKGVRSVCEVFLHVSGDNVAIAAPLGAKVPAGIDLKTVETCPASKQKVIAEMQTLFAAVRSAVVATPDGESDAVVDFFGSKRTKRALLLALAEHAGEHLGQSIAYARMNGVVPPWSAKP